ncbi:MAG: hypothetical protein ACFWUC_07435 [Oscillospiraceae bacterium]
MDVPLILSNNMQKETDTIIKNLLYAHKKICKKACITNAPRIIEFTKQLINLINDASQPRVKLIPPNDSDGSQKPPNNV